MAKLPISALNSRLRKLTLLAQDKVLGNPNSTLDIVLWDATGDRAKIVNLVAHDKVNPANVAANVVNIIAVPRGKVLPCDIDGNWLDETNFMIPEGKIGRSAVCPGRNFVAPSIPVWAEPPTFEDWCAEQDKGLRLVIDNSKRPQFLTDDESGLQVDLDAMANAETEGQVPTVGDPHVGTETPDNGTAPALIDGATAEILTDAEWDARTETARKPPVLGTLERPLYKAVNWTAPDLDSIPSLCGSATIGKD